MLERYARFATDNARLVLVGVALVTVAALFSMVDVRTLMPRLVLDSSIESMLPAEDENKQYYDHIRRVFGSDETLLLGVHRPDGIFEPETLRGIDRLTERIEDEVPGIHHVTSLANAPTMRSEQGDLIIAPLWEEVPEDPAALAAIRDEALEDPLLSGSLVAEEGRSTALLIYLLDISENEFTSEAIDHRIKALGREELPNAQVFLAGGAHVKAETTRFLIRDIATVIPIAFLLMAVIAYVSFRTWRGVLVPVTTIGLSLAWTVGVGSWILPSLNQITSSVPAVLLAIGFAYAIHVVNAINEAGERSEDPDETSASIARRGLAMVSLPTLLTGATTAAGFISLMTSSLGAIQEFAVFASVGVLCTMVASLTFPPAVLALLPRQQARRGSERVEESDWIARLLHRMGNFNVERRLLVLGVGALLAVLSLMGLLRIQLNTDLISNFPASSEIRQDFDAVNEHLGGAGQMIVIVETAERDGFKEPVNLRTLEKLQEWIIAQPEVGGATSLVDYVKLLNRGFNENAADAFAIPETKRLVSQLLFFGGSDDIERFADSQFQITNTSVRTKIGDSGEVAKLIERFEERLAELPDHLTGRVTGGTVLVAQTNDDIAWGQATSLGSAIVIIYIILVLLFTSFRVGFVALVPNILPVLVYFGALGWFGIDLNIVTGLVACLVLGIAVDDTIHFFAHFNAAAKENASEAEGVKHALVEVGRPVTYTSIALCLGFSVLCLSSLQNQVTFGALAAFTLAVAWLTDITFTPALASNLKIVTLWDALTLDLGDDPARAIPVFHGLSTTQARVAALMTEIVEFSAGERLITVGEKGDGMYVVVEGKLRSSVARDGERVTLNEHERGDVVGEVGLFHGERSADVDCETDVRLLRLDETNLDRLRKRYPRIGVQLFRNLSEILAARLVSATSRVR